MGGLGMRELVILLLIVLVFWPWAIILKKAGYSRLWILLVVVPFVNYIALWVFALSDWPALRANGRQS
jgi:hypothetical protein